MRSRFASITVLVILASAACLHGQQRNPRDPNIAHTDALTPAEEAKKFHLPPGFAMQLVAAEPTIKKPINIAFDARGRLWVTGSEEYPFPAPKDRKPKDKVVILEDFGPDGLARKSTVFADGLNIPIGVLPMPDCKSALVYSIPNIWMLTDTDGDGKADKKEAMYTGFGTQDTHGMTGEFVWGFDGWVYCCHGFFNTSHVKAANPPSPPLGKGGMGGSIKMHSGNTYRIKPDGSRIEQYTWGQVNPFGLCFDPLGNLYSTDCHTRPLYQLLKGAYYPSFGKPHDGLGFGPEMVTHDHGSTAIAGIAYYAADHYPKEFHDNLFVGNVVTNRINRDRIEWHGSTPKGIEMPDLVKSDDPWFRPVDIKLGPDGALYVADFYTRIIGHYEVPLNHPLRDFDKGRIWRIVYVGEDGASALRPVRDLTKATLSELVTELGNPNLSVRMMAANQLVPVSTPAAQVALPTIVEKGTTLQKIHGMWVLERSIENAVILDNELLKKCLDDKDKSVRIHALKIISERPRPIDPPNFTLKQPPPKIWPWVVETSYKDAEPFVQRAAAEALGNIRDGTSMQALIDLQKKIVPSDTHLAHVIRIGLRNQLRDDPQFLDFITFKAANMEKYMGIEPLADVCLAIPSRESASFLLHHGLKNSIPLAQFQSRVHHISRHATDEMRVTLLKTLRELTSIDESRTVPAIRAIIQGTQERGGQLKVDERRWAQDTVVRLLDSNASKPLQDGIDLAGAMRLFEAQPALLGISKNPERPEAQRKSAIAALVAIEPRKHVEPLARLLLDDKETIGVREQIASSLAGVNQAEAYTALVQAFEKAPARLQTTIALGMAGSPQGTHKLLDAVAAGKASARLLQDRAIELKLRQSRVGNLDARLAKLTKGLPAADQKALELIAQRRQGFASAQTDVNIGRMLFEKNCANCHILANKGAKIGPQLDGIGIRGLERLLEDILDPSRNVDQAFRSTTLELDNGQFVTGLLLREEGKVLVLADNMGKEVRVEGSKVANRTVGQLSPMPANFAEQITERDFHHLMAYLLEQRVKQ